MTAKASVPFALFCVALATGCSSGGGQGPVTEGTSTMNMNLTLPGGVTIDSVQYLISASDGAPIANGSVEVGNSVVLRTILTLPAGSGDLATLSATSVDGSITCIGTSGRFNVVAQHPITVPVSLQCGPRAPNAGVVTLEGTPTPCATIESITVNPSETTVGSSLVLGAVAMGLSPADVTYAWSAAGGTLTDANQANASFTCTAPGTFLVTLTVGDGAPADGGAACGGSQSFNVQCDAVTMPTMCGDTQTDPNNCGSCGHSCGGGACLGGACQPVVLASNICPTSIAVDDTNVYFTHDIEGSWAVESVPKTGGTVQVLASASAPASSPIFADSVGTFQGQVYFIQLVIGGNNTLESVPIGGGPVTLVSEPGVVGSLRQPTRAIVSNATGLYWSNEEGGILRIDPSNNQTFVVQPAALIFPPGATEPAGTAYPVTLAVDSNNVYFTSNTTTPLEFLSMAPVAGGALTTIDEVPFPFLTGRPLPLSAASIVSDGTNVYWATLQAPGAMFRVPVQPGPRSLFAQAISLGATVTSLAIDGSRLYWTEHDSAGTIGAASLQTEAVTPLAVGQSFPFAIAVDDTSIYWANAGVDVTSLEETSPSTCAGGSIMKLAK